MPHVHYDLAAAEATMRADVEKTVEAGRRLVQNGTVDPNMLTAQQQFDEPRIQFVLSGMKCENAGIGRKDMLSAAGFAIGSIWAGALSATTSAEERAVLNGWLQQALAQAIGVQPAAKTIESVISPMESGQA